MNSGSNPNNNEKGVEVRTHDIPIADAMSEFMKQGWAPSLLSGVNVHPSIPYTKLRREKLSFKFNSSIDLDFNSQFPNKNGRSTNCETISRNVVQVAAYNPPLKLILLNLLSISIDFTFE